MMDNFEKDINVPSKEIIIDGVDVSNCDYWHQETKSCGEYKCEDYPKCYYKQLKRKEKDLEQVSKAYEQCKESRLKAYNKLEEKEQERKEWKHQAELGVDTTNRLTKELEEKEEECEKLKEQLNSKCFDPKSNNNRCISYNRIAEDYERDLKQLNQLKAENEELKEKLENYCYDCDVAERMAKVTYAATGGRLSYSNYTLEAIEQAYNDQLRIDVEYRTKELQEQLDSVVREWEEYTETYKQALKNIAEGKIGKCCCPEEYAMEVLSEK